MHAAASKACPHSFLAGLQVAREVGAREHTLAEGGMSLPLPPAPLSPQEGEGGGALLYRTRPLCGRTMPCIFTCHDDV
jgi:hypothetical protein